MPAIKKSALVSTVTPTKKAPIVKKAPAKAKETTSNAFALSDRMKITRAPAKKKVAAAPVALKKAPAKKIAPAKVPAKKAVARKAPVLSPEAKKAERLANARKDLTPLKVVLNKTQLMERLAQDSGLEKRDVVKVYGALEKLLLSSMMPKGSGDFTLPGIAKLTAKKIPAKKGGQKVMSFGVERISKAKPATVRVKCRLLAKVRQVALPL